MRGQPLAHREAVVSLGSSPPSAAATRRNHTPFPLPPAHPQPASSYAPPPEKYLARSCASVKEKKNQGKLFPDAPKPEVVVPVAGSDPVTVGGAQVPRSIVEGRPARTTLLPFRIHCVSTPRNSRPCRQPLPECCRRETYPPASAPNIVAEIGSVLVRFFRPPRINTPFASAGGELPLLSSGSSRYSPLRTAHSQ